MKYIINQIMKNVMDSMMKITTKTLEGDMDITQAVEEIKSYNRCRRLRHVESKLGKYR